MSPLKMALQAVLAGTSQIVELRDPFHPAGFTEFERAFFERWRDDCNAKNARHWARLVADMKRRATSHQHIQQKLEGFLDSVHSSLAVSYTLPDKRKEIQTLLRKTLNKAKDFDEEAAKQQAQINASIELFKSFGDEFPSKTLRGLQERAREFEQDAVSLRQEAAKLESWLPWAPGTRQQRSSAHHPGGKRDNVARRAFMQSLSYIMGMWLGQPNDSIVAAITTLAFPEDEATERDVRHAREAPAVTPLASSEALAAAANSSVHYLVKLAEESCVAQASGDFPRADELAAELAKAQAELAPIDAGYIRKAALLGFARRSRNPALLSFVRRLLNQNGDLIRNTPPNSLDKK